MSGWKEGFVTAALFAIAAGFWFAQVYGVARPQVKLESAPATEFSAMRAEAVLAHILSPERPHPVSTDENAAVRARILKEFAALGIPASVRRGFGCNTARSYAFIACASVNDILAEVKPGEGKAIILMAHYDSVPAGPGAADDEADVAAIVETAGALKARGLAGKHPILALITDGEEADLLGAAAFLHDSMMRARVGAVINVEARGNRGRSLLFQTSPGDGPLIDLYAKSVPNYAASSLYAEIYRVLPNDTDLTLFIRDGFPSYNFAFTENVAHYHTALDTRANLDPRSLQQQGDNLLGLVAGLERTDFASLKGDNDIYFDILGRYLPRLPASWAFPLSILAFVLMPAAALLVRGDAIGRRRWLAAFAVTPALLVGAGLLGWLLHAIASLVSGMPDPSYARPTVFRLALSLGVVAITLLVSRMAPPRAAVSAVWLWVAGLGMVVANFVPGTSPYFLLPALIAAALLYIARALPGGLEKRPGQAALLLASLPMLLLWVGFGAAGESIMGLKLHPVFTIPIAFGLTTLVPLFAMHSLPHAAWRAVTVAAFAMAAGFAVVAGMQPSFSEMAPQRLNVTYFEDGKRSLWALDALAPVPPSMRAVAGFADKPERISPFAWSSSYLAPAPNLKLPLPVANAVKVGEGRIQLDLKGSAKANQMAVIFENPSVLKSIGIGDWHFDAVPQWRKLEHIVFACMSRDCATAKLDLRLQEHAHLNALVGENRFGLPPESAALVSARPRTAVPSQNGDGILLINRLSVVSK